MRRSQNHTIDFLFPLALFFVFSATALVILLFAANVYKTIVNDSTSRFEQQTSLSYVTNKIRQSDAGGSSNIYLDQFDGCDALAIKQSYADTAYITYIYESAGELKEIFLQEGVTAPAQAGTTILSIEDFQMKELSSGLFQFTCISADGSEDSVIIGLQSTAPQ